MSSAEGLRARAAQRSLSRGHGPQPTRAGAGCSSSCSAASGAATAWWFAAGVLLHNRPFFAPVTAIICLGMSFGQRLRRVAEVMIGVAVGVFIGDVFVHFFGSGVWQIVVVVVISMTHRGAARRRHAAHHAGRRAVGHRHDARRRPGQAFTRWLDAVVGGCVALLFTLVAPASPLRRPRQQAAARRRGDQRRSSPTRPVRCAAATPTSPRPPWPAPAPPRHAREARALSAEGIAVVRLSPFRRRHLPGVQAIADLLEPLDRAIRNLRVLVRRAAIATWREEPVPTAYLRLLEALVADHHDIAHELGERRLPTDARVGLHRIGEASAVIDPSSGLSGEVMRAQIRSMVVDLLMLTGLPHDEARDMVPESMTTGPQDD